VKHFHITIAYVLLFVAFVFALQIIEKVTPQSVQISATPTSSFAEDGELCPDEISMTRGHAVGYGPTEDAAAQASFNAALENAREACMLLNSIPTHSQYCTGPVECIVASAEPSEGQIELGSQICTDQHSDRIKRKHPKSDVPAEQRWECFSTVLTPCEIDCEWVGIDPPPKDAPGSGGGTGSY
jgi:ribonuclease HI